MFSEKFKHRFEIFITYFGIGLFIVHFALIMAIQFGLISGQYFPENLFGHPFASLFSPFSILLIYEVYLLIYYLRKSYTKSVAKQLEIMALILLRISFGFEGWERIFTIVLGACVAVFMLWISERSAFKNSRISA